MPPELPQREGAFTAQIFRHVKPAAQAKIAAHALTADLSHTQRHARTYAKNVIIGQRFTVQRERNFSARHHQLRIAVEFQRRAAEGDLKRGGIIFITQQTVTQTQRQAVHWPGWRNANRPVTCASRVILHRGLRTGAEHLQRGRLVHQVLKTAGPGLTCGKRREGQDLLQIIAVGFNAINTGLPQRGMQHADGGFACRLPGDHFG